MNVLIITNENYYYYSVHRYIVDQALKYYQSINIGS